jgi:acetyltransferase-like isoleucine patch superfamily enzyme
MLNPLTPNQTELVSLDNSNSLLVKSRTTVHKLLQKALGKSVGQLISLIISKIVTSLTLMRYRLQYPNVKFGSSVMIRGKFSVEGKGQVEIGNYCYFISSPNQTNKIYIPESSASLTIGDNCFFNATSFLIEGEGKVEVGNHCYFNSTSIKAVNFIEFKKQCLVSDALLVDTDFHSIEINRRNPNLPGKSKPICVNENAWVGSQSMILKGVTIGKNSVVGARTVVRQSVPDNVVVIGNPQQIVKELDTTVLPYDFSQ